MKTVRNAVLFLALAAAAAPAFAGHGHSERPIDERRPLKADGRLSVENVAGMIDVETWDKNEVWVTGELGEDVEKLEITGSDSSLKIEVRLPRSMHNVDADTILKLKVPAGVNLTAEGVSADISVRGLKGPLNVETVSGDLRLDVQSPKVKAASVSGDLSLTAPKSSDTRVSSVSGDLTVRGVSGEFNGESVSGNLHLAAKALTLLDLETVSGDLELDVELAKGARVEAESLSGEVTLTLPSMPEGDIDLETFSGEVSGGWDLVEEDDGKEMHKRGKGEGRVRLQSFSGDIRIRQR